MTTLVATTFACDRLDPMTDEQLARALALSRTSRKAVKRLLYDLDLPCSSPEVDKVLDSITGHPREGLIRALADNLCRQFDAPIPFTLHRDLLRYLRSRGIIGDAVVQMLTRRTGLSEKQVQDFLAGDNTNALLFLQAVGASKILFADLGDPND